MKILKDNHPHEQKMQKLDEYLLENKISIEVCGGVFFVNIEGKEYRLLNVEDNSNMTGIPRCFDTERLTYGD